MGIDDQVGRQIKNTAQVYKEKYVAWIVRNIKGDWEAENWIGGWVNELVNLQSV